jgi:glycerol kinase
MAYQVNDLIQSIEDDSGLKLTELRVDGGAAANNFLMRFQSGLLDAPVLRPANTEATALGAAFLAGLSTGFWQSLEQINSLDFQITRFEPDMMSYERSVLLSQWREAVSRTRSDCLVNRQTGSDQCQESVADD